EEARQRVLSADDVLVAAVVERAAVLVGELRGLHTRSPVAHAAVPDPVAVLGDALHHRGRARLLLHGVAIVAVEEGVLLEEPVGAARGVTAVKADRMAGPVSAEADLAPRVDRLA